MGVPNKAVVEELEGFVEFREQDSTDWSALLLNDTVPGDAEIRVPKEGRLLLRLGGSGSSLILPGGTAIRLASISAPIETEEGIRLTTVEVIQGDVLGIFYSPEGRDRFEIKVPRQPVLRYQPSAGGQSPYYASASLEGLAHQVLSLINPNALWPLDPGDMTTFDPALLTWGYTPSALEVIPEPSTFALAVAGFLLLLIGGRARARLYRISTRTFVASL